MHKLIFRGEMGTCRAPSFRYVHRWIIYFIVLSFKHFHSLILLFETNSDSIKLLFSCDSLSLNGQQVETVKIKMPW
jgi:hypothetical protein